MIPRRASDTCPCGGLPSGAALGDCCLPLLEGTRTADTAEALMRSRFTAFALDNADYLFRTWHPRTRPADTQPDAEVEWTSLDILDTVDGGAGDSTGIVEFAAHYRVGGQPGTMRERSSFVTRAGRWFYVDGEHESAG